MTPFAVPPAGPPTGTCGTLGAGTLGVGTFTGGVETCTGPALTETLGTDTACAAVGAASTAAATHAPRTRARPWRISPIIGTETQNDNPQPGCGHLQAQRLGDDVLLDLGGSSVDRRHHRPSQVALHRVFARVSVAAHDLHALERAALRELGGGELRHRRLLRKHPPRVLVGEARDPSDQ